MGGDYSQYYEQYWNNYAAWQNYGTYYDPYSSSYGDYNTGLEGGTGDAKDTSKEDFEPVGEFLPLFFASVFPSSFSFFHLLSY